MLLFPMAWGVVGITIISHYALSTVDYQKHCALFFFSLFHSDFLNEEFDLDVFVSGSAMAHIYFGKNAMFHENVKIQIYDLYVFIFFRWFFPSENLRKRTIMRRGPLESTHTHACTLTYLHIHTRTDRQTRTHTTLLVVSVSF
jgi:hypothetical protein